MKVLLLSAYDTPSHRYWCESIQRHLPEIDWTYLYLPGRYFSWRIRGNALTWSVRDADRLGQQYDFILATSMTDLATLRGLCPSLSSVPNILYFHENQFAYPVTASAHASVEPQMVTLYSALCADRLVFNSQYNQRSFLDGVDRLLRQFPDEVPAGIVPSLAIKSCVIPVPLESPVTSMADVRAKKPPMEIIWNHRWEYDKGPDALLTQVQSLRSELKLQFHVVGQQFRQQPSAFAELKQVLSERGWLGQWGFIDDRQAYSALLHRCHAVLSTATHDFQGLSVLEAVAAGCVPLVPQRLVYPEWFGVDQCYVENGQVGETLSDRITLVYHALAEGKGVRSLDLKHFCWDSLRPKYQALFR